MGKQWKMTIYNILLESTLTYGSKTRMIKKKTITDYSNTEKENNEMDTDRE